MREWGWYARTTRAEAERAVAELARRRGLERVDVSQRGAVLVEIVAAGDGVVVLGSDLATDEVARELSRTLGVAARCAEVELGDAEVAAWARDVDAAGALGPTEDHDELVSETCEEWFEGKKYRTEALHDLVGLCLGLEGDFPTGGTAIFFRRAGSARVGALLDAIRAGARWERTSVAGRTAVRVVDASGTRISVLSDDEMASFESAVTSVE